MCPHETGASVCQNWLKYNFGQSIAKVFIPPGLLRFAPQQRLRGGLGVIIELLSRLTVQHHDNIPVRLDCSKSSNGAHDVNVRYQLVHAGK